MFSFIFDAVLCDENGYVSTGKRTQKECGCVINLVSCLCRQHFMVRRQFLKTITSMILNFGNILAETAWHAFITEKAVSECFAMSSVGKNI